MSRKSRFIPVILLCFALTACNNKAANLSADAWGTTASSPDTTVTSAAVTTPTTEPASTTVAAKAEYDPTKQLTYEEFTINGKHITEDFGEPVSVENVNPYDEYMSGISKSGEHSFTKHFNGFDAVYWGIYESDGFSYHYMITGKNVSGPRGIKVGDTLESVLAKLPSTLEEEADTMFYDYDINYVKTLPPEKLTGEEPESYQVISAGTVMYESQPYTNNVVLVTKTNGQKRLDSVIIYNTQVSTKFLGVQVDLINNIVESIRISLIDAPPGFEE